MVISQPPVAPEFTGSAANKKLAAAAFDVLRGRGMFMSDYSPIQVPLADLGELLASQDHGSIDALRKAISANREVFSLVTEDDAEIVLTTRTGRAPVPNDAPSTHSLVNRFLAPLPKPVRPPRPVFVRPQVDPNWATYSVPEYADEDEDAYLSLPDEPEHVDVIVVPEAAPTIEAETAEPITLAEAAEAERQVEPIITPVEALPTEPAAVADPEPAPEPAELEAAPEAIVVDEPVAEVEEIVAAPEPAPAPVTVPEPETVREPMVVTRPTFKVSDFSGFDDAALAAALHGQVASDSRIAQFGDLWMAEDQVARLGRNDVRRIKDYISEQEQPLTDDTLAQDILNVRPNSADFANLRFAVNYRLAHEHREFDFVGTNDQRFWSTSSLPQIGTTRRKPNDIGTDYRYLVEEIPAEVAHRSAPSVSHVLSFYEFVHGLLPYDLDMQQLLPKPVLPDQRSAVLTFEIPQFYTTYLVELRYPTPNRGGFLLGLDDFYAESLVPGALIQIKATDNDGHYLVEFLTAANQSERLLDLDDRRSPRFHFRPTSFACEVAPEWVISEEKFPRLGNEKPLDDKVRRRPDVVVEAAFERAGLEDGDTLIATFDDLLTVANIDRPFSPELLRTTLEQLGKVSSDDGDTFLYARA